MIRPLICALVLALGASSADAAKGGRASRPPSPAQAKPHGNSAASTKPQHLYAITKRLKEGTKTKIAKFGISGGAEVMRGGARPKSARAEWQVKKLNAVENSKYVYSSRIIDRAPNRRSALFMERQAVTRHAASAKRDEYPLSNKRPKPFPFSRLK